MPTSIHVTRRVALVGVLAFAGGTALAQGRPVRFLLSVSAGSAVDAVTRAASRSLEQSLGHPVVVENQPGAGGLIGTQNLMKSAPDGHTLSVISANHLIFPMVLKNVTFDPVNDFTPIANLGTTPLVLAISNKVPANDLKELLALMRTKPDGLTYGSPGSGTFLHLSAAAFLDAAGVKARHIPYKGGSAMVTDLISGQIDIGTIGLPQAIGSVKGGTLRPVALLAEHRTTLLPNLPTATELGVPFAMDGWFGIVGPKGMTAEVVARVHAAVIKAFNAPEVKEAMLAQGATVEVSSPSQARAFLQAETARFASIVQKAGIVAQ